MKNLESQLQIACVRWFRYEFPEYGDLLFSVPNGGKRHIATARKLKAEGVVAGVSDLILMVPNKDYHGLCIEMKYGKGKQTDNQKRFQKSVEEQGYKYIVSRTFDDFEKRVSYYLKVK